MPYRSLIVTFAPMMSAMVVDLHSFSVARKADPTVKFDKGLAAARWGGGFLIGLLSLGGVSVAGS